MSLIYYLINKVAVCSISPHAPGALSTLEGRVSQLGAVDVSGVARMTVINTRIYKSRYGMQQVLIRTL